MKPLAAMTQPEIGAYVQSHLAKVGIEVVLSGGASVSVYSNGEYVSKDLTWSTSTLREGLPSTRR